MTVCSNVSVSNSSLRAYKPHLNKLWLARKLLFGRGERRESRGRGGKLGQEGVDLWWRWNFVKKLREPENFQQDLIDHDSLVQKVLSHSLIWTKKINGVYCRVQMWLCGWRGLTLLWVAYFVLDIYKFNKGGNAGSKWDLLVMCVHIETLNWKHE